MSGAIHSEENFGIVVHGGAGVMAGLSEEKQERIQNKIRESVSQAYLILEEGGSSLDAVELAVSILEDSPLFNAGRGSVYNSDEVQEMDASIMDGKNRLTGAVASISIVINESTLFTSHRLIILIVLFAWHSLDLNDAKSCLPTKIEAAFCIFFSSSG